MKKYFIKSLFSGWKEVSKEKYETFRLHIINKALTSNAEEIADKHTKIVEVKTK